MSKYQTVKEIKKEIERLNKEIDLRIIHGLSYSILSRRHKILVNQLRRLVDRGNWLIRSFGLISTFIF